ncbi:hypothetical protein IAU60_001508 [Kwoniella sp. DSM 27419]
MSGFPTSPTRQSPGASSSRMSPDSPPAPPRLSKSEIASFLNIVQDLEGYDRSDLVKQLSEPSWRGRGEAPARPVGDPRRPGDGPDAGAELDDASSGSDTDVDGQDRRSRRSSTTRPRRVDGPSFTPTYQDAKGSTNALARRKARRREDQADGKASTSTRWPLAPAEIPPEVDHEYLKEAITTFASRYLRTHKLRFPPDPLDAAPVPPSDNADELELELEPELPEDLVGSTIQMIDSVLVNLAVCRPVGVGRERRHMGTMDWGGVVEAACLTPELRGIAKRANARLRRIYHSDEQDILAYRLGRLESDLAPTRGWDAVRDLYASVLPKKDTEIRAHQSKDEQARRAEKKRLREEKAAARSAVLEQGLNTRRAGGAKRKRTGGRTQNRRST